MLNRAVRGACLALLAAGPISAQTESYASHAHSAAQSDGEVPLYTNLGTLHYAVTTVSSEAQAYFDQGLRLYWGFNHAESARAFAEAVRLDTTCALCAFGQALAFGPNINAPMDSADGAAAWEITQRATAAAAGVNEREQAMIAALRLRYDPATARAAADSAWAHAIGEVADRYPEDPELQAFAAEALMDLSPWYYWEKDGSPRPATATILARLEGVLARDANHPGACHLFIHAVEATQPARAVACAERLAALMPGAGHVVHMPGHIYIRVGRYRDAITANEHAVHADQSYFEGPAVSKQGMYALGYYPHNWHFMSFAAAMAGQGGVALRAARKVTESVGYEVARKAPWVEAVTPIVYWTLVNFGRWNDVLDEPLPPSDLRYTTGMAFYARGVAFAAKGRWAEARAALDSVQAVAGAMAEGENRVAMRIGARMVEGEIALRQGRIRDAVRHFRDAADMEDAMTYIEPPTWYFPVRHSLGKALLAAGEAIEAERVYRQDLDRFPENGWALLGLKLSLEKQGKRTEAAAVAARFQEAWRGADVRITSSRF